MSHLHKLWRRVRLYPRAALARVFGIEWSHVSVTNPHARERVLFVANDFLPTLQICFIQPLQALVQSGELAIDVLSETQMMDLYGQRRWLADKAQWVCKRFEQFNPTLLIFCRYSGPHGQVLRELARTHGVPVIYHIDDDLLNVPPEIGAAKYARHNDPRRLATVRELLADADLVYCSTEPLLKRMRPVIGGVAVSGKIYCAPAFISPTPQSVSPVRIGYMGFDHAHDLEIVVPALVRLLQNFPDVRFELFGSIPKPARLTQFGERIAVHPPIDNYERFMRKFAALGWHIGICPLADTAFNQLKANTKWVEYTSIGAAVVATGGTIYDDCCAHGCGILANSAEDWYEALARLVKNQEERERLLMAAQAKVREEYALDHLRSQVLAVFSQARQSMLSS